MKTEIQKIFLEEEMYEEVMMMYDCAMLEVKTKLEVLNNEFQIRSKRNPIEFIKCRIKSQASILEKLKRKGLECTLESILENINDIAGIRVVCSFIDDIYAIAGMLEKQDDINVVEKDDYISSPKPNGYRSLHMDVEIPVFFSDKKQKIRVEVQIRTIAMDFWASLEHQIYYKKGLHAPESIIRELKECAETIAVTDFRMQDIRKELAEHSKRGEVEH
jgi:putative GTP pyrophosphokinase